MTGTLRWPKNPASSPSKNCSRPSSSRVASRRREGRSRRWMPRFMGGGNRKEKSESYCVVLIPSSLESNEIRCKTLRNLGRSYVIQVKSQLWVGHQGLHDPTVHARFNIRREGGTERRGGRGNGKVERTQWPPRGRPEATAKIYFFYCA